MKNVLTALAVSLLSAIPVLATDPFLTIPLDVSPAGTQVQAAIGDVDGDGRNEVVVIAPAAPAAGGSLRVFDVAGNGSVTLKYSMPLMTPPNANIWSWVQPRIVDVNGDGVKDIAAYLRANGHSGYLQIFTRDNSCSCFHSNVYQTPEADAAYGFDMADINRDGYADAITANNGANAPQSIFVTYGGPGGFSTHSEYPFPFNGATGAFGASSRGIVHVYASDLDRDGRPDIYVSTAPGNNVAVHILYNKATGLSPWDVAGAPSIDLFAGDKNGDGWIDLVFSGDHTSDVRFCIGPAFSPDSMGTLASPAEVRSPLLGDFNGDRVTDFAYVVTSLKNVTIRGGSFQATIGSAEMNAADFLASSYTQLLTSGDVDNDGRPDLLLTLDRVILIKLPATDTTPPVLTLPANMTVSATSAAGATVTFTATAVDNVDGNVSVTCTPPSGTTFPLGTALVSCTAKDLAGNVASGTFSVTVKDTNAPALSVPNDLVVEATGPNGANASWTATAVDDVTANVAVVCTPASGSAFGFGTATVTCSATDGAGNNSSKSFHVTVRDTTGPALTLPSNITLEATSTFGAVATWSASATDAVSGNATVQCTPASGSTFAIATTTVHCSATDAASNTANGSFTVTVQDKTAPVLTLPSNMTVEASMPAGAVVSFNAAATDAISGDVSVQCTPASGSTFALGTTTVSCSAADAAGNTANGSFTVTVRDTIAPTLTLPQDRTVEATSPAGATVSFVIHASDVVSGNVSVQCSASSGSTFAFGTTTVSCTTSDAAGNTTSGSFKITVVDTTAPTLTLPSNMTVEATAPNGATVNFNATARDAVSGNVAILCTPAAGTTFALGTTTVSCVATDDAGNRARGSFSVTVSDTTAPALTLPSNITDEATSANGRAISWTATATDAVSGNVNVQCSPASGSVFTIGTTTVHCSASDGAGNGANGSFTVTIRDTRAPSLTLPSNMTEEATSASGRVISWTASASDAVSGNVAVQCAPASGSLFAIGTTPVNCSATDASGNTANGSFTVTIRDTRAPSLTLPSNMAVEATSAAGANVSWSASATDAVSGSVAVQCTPASGSLFALGTRTVNCSASDAAGNTATGSFTVTVADHKAPTLTLPSNITTEPTSASGATVTWIASATDLVSGSVNVQCTPASGSLFAVGTTTVNCSASDAAGNTANGSFTVTVRDAVPPVLTLPSNITADATGAGTKIEWIATAKDAISGNVPVTCTPASGSLFGFGTTTVNCSASDASGNVASGSFTVTIRDTKPPVLTLPSNMVVDATSAAGANVSWTASATDVVSGNVPVVCTPASGSLFAFGTKSVSCTATDGAGNSASGSFTVTVRDVTPPRIFSIAADPNTIWSPDKRMVPVQILVSVSDAGDSAPVSRIISVSSSDLRAGDGESGKATADDTNSADWIITGPLSLQLRATKNGSERVYLITVESRDKFGNVATAKTTVTVVNK
jgi:hypothetical protein